jgi:hypothetical protein
MVLWYNPMLVARYEIGIVKRSAQVGAGIEIALTAPRIPFVVLVRRRRRNDHVSASESSA